MERVCSRLQHLYSGAESSSAESNALAKLSSCAIFAAEVQGLKLSGRNMWLAVIILYLIVMTLLAAWTSKAKPGSDSAGQKASHQNAEL